MIKNAFIFITLILMSLLLLPLATDIKPMDSFNSLAERYMKEGPKEVGSANPVTSVVVTYRGFDTLGEVTVLFTAFMGVGLLLRRKEDEEMIVEAEKREGSEILQTASNFITPLLFIFGIYVFVHGHLSAGGGFQGGVIIASAILLGVLSRTSYKINDNLVLFVDSFAGLMLVILATLGVILAGGFMDNRYIGLGEYGKLFSAGAIPFIYSFIGIKVGSMLTGILKNMSQG